jgi:hypothetical protein
VNGLAADAVGIAHLEAALVFRAWLKVEDASGEGMGDGVLEMLPAPEDALASDAKQGERFPPRRFPGAPEADFDRGIPVVIPRNRPVKSEVVQSGVLNGVLARDGGILAGGRQPQQGQEKAESAHRFLP